MKKLITLIFFGGMGYLGYLFFSAGPEYLEEDFVLESTYEHKEELPTYKTYDLDEDDEKESFEEDMPKRVQVKEREIESYDAGPRNFVGPDFRPIHNVPNNLKFENKVNPNWEKKLINEFLEDEEEEASANLEIQKIDSLIFVKDEVGMYVEKVKIVVTEPEDMAGSFFAYVDSSNGEIFHAWEEDDGPQAEFFGDSEFEGESEDGQFVEHLDEDFEEGIEYSEEDMYEMGPEELGYAPGMEDDYEDYN